MLHEQLFTRVLWLATCIFLGACASIYPLAAWYLFGNLEKQLMGMNGQEQN